MSAFSRYAAECERVASVLAHEETKMLHEMSTEYGDMCPYPVSADMLATVTRGTTYQRKQRRKKAAELRATA